jgi:hypothetical protein
MAVRPLKANMIRHTLKGGGGTVECGSLRKPREVRVKKRKEKRRGKERET